MDSGIIIFFAVIIIGLLIINSNKKSEDSRISNKQANIEDITTDLKSFKPKIDDKLKNGFTEKSIENQLYKNLIAKYQTVTQQFGIQGTSAKAIDLDIANGVVGIELKLSSEILKSTSFDRMKGQLLTYQEKRYDNENLILMVFGSKEDSLNTAINHDLKEFCKRYDIIIIYIVIKI